MTSPEQLIPNNSEKPEEIIDFPNQDVAIQTQKIDNDNQTNQHSLRVRGILLFVLINIIWGTTFPLVEKTLVSISPSVLIAVRFTLAALFFSVNLRRLNKILLRDGLILGLLFFIYLATETIALKSIHANRAAFIASLCAIFVPLLELFLGQRFLVRTFIAALLAVIGIGVICWEGENLGSGDLLTVIGALIYAVYTLVLERVAKNHPPLSLTSVQLVLIAVLGLIWSSPELFQQVNTIGSNWIVLIYLGLVATAIVNWLQTLAQQWIRSDEAALLYTLEPIFSALFSFLLLGEKFGVSGFIGASIVLCAIAIGQSAVILNPDSEPN